MVLLDQQLEPVTPQQMFYVAAVREQFVGEQMLVAVALFVAE